MNIKKHIEPDAFLRPALDALELDVQDTALVRRFAEEKAEEIRKLWDQFIQEVAIEKVVEQSPSMQVRIRNTPLSNRVKNTLECHDVFTVGELLQYSVSELRKFRHLGKKSVREILDYLEDAGLSVLSILE